MAFLINRTPPARLSCLQYLLQLIDAKFGRRTFFMSDIMFDRNSINIHNLCKLLTEDKAFNIKYCPFLKNPLSEAGCYLTRAINNDTTKRKEISNTVNALGALGFLRRRGRELQITDLGLEFTRIDFKTQRWLQIIRKAICCYGPMVGLLYQIYKKDVEFSVSNLIVGYPNAEEAVRIEGKTIEISSGSQRDSNTRTKSCLLAWATTAGFIAPRSLAGRIAFDKAHIDTNNYILYSTRNNRIYRKGISPDIFDRNFITEIPLDYDNLTKNVRALREHGQKVLRQETMRYNDVIKNRRLAILYSLNKAFQEKKLINLNSLKEKLLLKPEWFVVSREDFNKVINVEIKIAFVAGIPFEVESGKYLKPVTGLKESVLIVNAPSQVISYLSSLVKEILS